MTTIENVTTSKRLRRMLGLSLHDWENVMVASLAGTAFAAIIVGMATYCVVQLQRKEIADSKAEFNRYKLTVEGQVAEAKKEGVKAGEAAGNALVRAAELQKQAEEIRRSNLALENEIAPRRLNSSEMSDLKLKVLAFPGKKLLIRSYALDVEAAIFGQQIIEAMNGTSIQIIDMRMSEQTMGGVAVGVWISGPNQSLISAINAGLPPRVARTFGSPPRGAGMMLGDPTGADAPDATIFIAAKPPTR